MRAAAGVAPARVPTARAVTAMAATKPRVRLDVWSDFSCPWCFVGKKRMDKALQQLEDKVEFEIVYHPYVIDHATAREGEEYLAYNQRRWGSDGWTHDLRRAGRPDGATFSDWRWWPNSLKAHQLLLLAQEQDKGREAKELLLRMTYEEGKNISLVDTLVEAAEQLGLPDVRQYLEEDQGRQAVLQDDRTGKQQYRISGVPYFIVGPGGEAGSSSEAKSYALSGAQSTRAFVQTISKVLA